MSGPDTNQEGFRSRFRILRDRDGRREAAAARKEQADAPKATIPPMRPRHPGAEALDVALRTNISRFMNEFGGAIRADAAADRTINIEYGKNKQKDQMLDRLAAAVGLKSGRSIKLTGVATLDGQIPLGVHQAKDDTPLVGFAFKPGRDGGHTATNIRPDFYAIPSALQAMQSTMIDPKADIPGMIDSQGYRRWENR